MATGQCGLLVEGLSRLQCREIFDSVDEGSIQLDTRTDASSLQVIGETALVIVVVGYPIAKAIARVIARDRTTIRISRALSDGTVEVISIDSTAVSQVDNEDSLEKKIIAALEG